MERFIDAWNDPTARRKILTYGGGGVLFILLLIIIIVVVVTTSGSSAGPFHGRYVLDEEPLVDGHNDLPYNIYLREKNLLENFNFTSNLKENEKWNTSTMTPSGSLQAHTDLGRLKEGKVGGQVQNKGIIMIPFGTFFLAPPGTNVTIDTVIEHMDYIRNVTNSTEYIGIGADYDGVGAVPFGLEDVSKYPDLFDKLAIETDSHAAWSREDLRNLASGNLIRVMKAVEKFRDDNIFAPIETAIKLKEAAIPVEDFKNTDTTCRTDNVTPPVNNTI